MDYYSPHHGVVLPRPLLIGALPGARGDDVAHAIASLTGLPVDHLDAQLMHQSGRALSDDVRTFGKDAIIQRKDARLHQLINRALPSVIALGDTSLISAATWRRISANADTVYIWWQPVEYRAFLEDISAMKRRQFWQLNGAIPTQYHDIKQHFKDCLSVLEGCAVTLPGRGRSAMDIAREIVRTKKIAPQLWMSGGD